MKFNQGKCKALHLGRKSKTSQAPSAWGVALWRSPWGLPSLLNLLDIPRSLLTTLGFSSHPSLHTLLPLRLQGWPAQEFQPWQRLLRALLLLHQPFFRVRACRHPRPWGPHGCSHTTDSCEHCNPGQDLNQISEWNSFWGEDHWRSLQSQVYDQHTSHFFPSKWITTDLSNMSKTLTGPMLWILSSRTQLIQWLI